MADKGKTIIYKGVDKGEWLVCSYCGRKMLLPYGGNVRCPHCGKYATLQWAYGLDYSHVDTHLLEVIGEEMELSTEELQPTDTQGIDNMSTLAENLAQDL